MKRLVVMLALAMLLGSSILACASPTPSAPNTSAEGTSIVNEYPSLKPVVDFTGEETLSVLNLLGSRAADRAMEELRFRKGDLNILALTDAGYSPS